MRLKYFLNDDGSLKTRSKRKISQERVRERDR